MRHPRRPLGILAAAGALLVLPGCSSTVATQITVTGADTAAVHVSATFTDEAAAAITGNAATRAQLLAVFTDRTGHAPTVSAGPHTFTVSQDLDYRHLSASADVLGLSGLALSGTTDAATVRLRLVPPTKLAAAVTSVTAMQPDATALARTMLRSTQLSVQVSFPGGVSQVQGDPTARVDGDAVTFTRTADTATSRVVSVSGDPSANRWPWLAGATALAASAALLWRRRTRSR